MNASSPKTHTLSDANFDALPNAAPACSDPRGFRARSVAAPSHGQKPRVHAAHATESLQSRRTASSDRLVKPPSSDPGQEIALTNVRHACSYADLRHWHAQAQCL